MNSSCGERLLVEERLRLARPQQRELEPADREALLDEVAQSSASSPTVTPAGSSPSLVERQLDAGDERLARGRVVADRERLAAPAEDHLLVGDEARAAGRVDRHVAARFAAAVAIAVPEGASSFVAWWSSTISAAAKWRAASRAKRIISTAPSAKFGA